MRRLTPSALAAALTVTAVAVLAPGGPAAAAPADVSVTAGPPGTRVEVSVTDCGTATDWSFLEVRLVSGTAPSEVLAGAGGGFDGEPAVLIVPDWIDPADPAVVEARCLDEEGVVRTYDPVAFDVEPGAEPGTQTRTASRTSLQAGQGLTVQGTGCTFAGATYAEAVVFPGRDRSGRTFDEAVAWGFSFVLADGSSITDVLLSDAGFAYAWSSFDGGPPMVDLVEEYPNSIAAGPHTLVPYCSADDGATLLLEPVDLDVTGRAPTDRIDLTAPADSSVVTLAGEACTAGPVEVELMADDLSDDFLFGDDQVDLVSVGDVAAARTIGSDRRAGPAAGPFAPPATDRSVAGGPGSLARSLADEGFVVDTVVPDGTGAWSRTEDSGLDSGVVVGFATCGDPFADGFAYDPQVLEITAEAGAPVPAPPPPAPGPAVVTPPPAGAIPGRPTYTG